MHYVYLLKSIKHDFVYIGYTNDLKNRLCEHNAGKSQATKYYVPFELVYYEAYLDQGDALDREKKLKHHGSVIGHLKKRLNKSLSKGKAGRSPALLAK